MPSFYDDPRWKVGGNRVRWSRFGDKVSGRIVAKRWDQIGKDSVAVFELVDATGIQDGQPMRSDKAELAMSPKHLQQAWDQERPEDGDIVDIVYLEDHNTGQAQPMKIFAFSVQRQLPVQPTPGDIFTR